MTRKELLSVAKPILFNTEMVRALLDGRKTVTRRPVKGVPSFAWNAFKAAIETKGCYEHAHKNGKIIHTYPPYKVGDILYVRETWGISTMDYDDKMIGIIYKASQNKKEWGYRTVKFPNDKFEKLYNSMAESSPDWRPSIHMPKEAARIFLRVTNVRVEQLRDITDEQVLREKFSSRTKFISAFLKMYPKCTVDSWVWVIEFEKVEVSKWRRTK